MELSFIKCHGSGNDFLLIDESSITLDESVRGLLVQHLCDRNCGIGADGVLFYQTATEADARMRIFNADGSEARMCGNGIRCLGRYAAEKLGKETVRIVVMDVVLTVRRVKDFFAGVEAYETEIGPILLAPASLPMVWAGDQVVDELLPMFSSQVRFTALSAPNPHLSARVAGIDKRALIRIGLLANGDHPIFPQGVNVSFRLVLGTDRLFVATYERGVGWTHSCGTAMTASTFAACLEGVFEFGSPIQVLNAGGRVVCTAIQDEVRGLHSGLLAGNATFEWDGVVTVDLLSDPLKPVLQDVRRVRDRDEEIRAYERFKSASLLNVRPASTMEG